MREMKRGDRVDIFKGYIPMKGKRPLPGYTYKDKKGKDLVTYERARHLNGYGGVLNDDIVQIDLDDMEESDLLFKIVCEEDLPCWVLETTRGKHFFFRNPQGDLTIYNRKVHARCALGLTVDVGIGTKNSLVPLKIEGVTRQWLRKTDEIMTLPIYLIVMPKTPDFTSLGDGDGRNQTLFNYILTLQSEGLVMEQVRTILSTINKYVLKTPLSDRELEVIYRDEAFQKPVFFKRDTFLFDKFAVYLSKNDHVIRINGQLHIYEDGIYTCRSSVIESRMIKHIPKLSKSQRNEVLAYLNILIRDNLQPVDADKIPFKNGIYDLSTNTLLPFSPEHIITNRINYNYEPGAYSEIMDKTLNKIACQDKSIRLLLEEMIGYCFYRRNELGKAFILTGDNNNGKSTFLDVVKTLFGDENICALDLKELGDRFKTAELFGKLVNIGDDIGDEFIANAAVFKKLTTGDRVNVERKGQDPFEFNNYSKFLFSANNIPRIKDKTGAVSRRLIIIPFNAQFSASDPDFDPFIKYKLRSNESMQYLIKIGLEGLKRVLVNRQFSKSEKVQNALEEYEEINNPVIGFVKELGEENIKNEPTKSVYMKYKEYCIMNNLQAISNIEFSRQITKRFGFETAVRKIKGQNTKIFIKK